MVRTTEVQYSAVAQACLELFRQGETVSFAKVYLALGSKGSGRVVNDLIRRWRTETGEQLALRSERSLPGVPPTVVAALDSLALSTWQLALDRAEEAYQAAQGRLEADREMWQSRLETAAALGAELAATQATLAARDEAIHALAATLQKEELARIVLETELTSLADERADLRARLSAEQEHQVQAQAAAEARMDERLAAIQDRYAAELAISAERNEGERQHLAAITDELRQGAKLKEAHLREQLEDAKALADSYRERAGRCGNELAALRGRLEADEVTIANLTAALARKSGRGKPLSA
jgi:hypothetical protein